MPVLADSDRVVVIRRIMERLSKSRHAMALTKPELRAAVNAIDQWLDGNAASFNVALPQPARTVLTPMQKAELLAAVALRKFEV